MAPEQKVKKRKASVPAGLDEAEREKKVKKLATDVAGTKRKATDEPTAIVAKKSKTPKAESVAISRVKATKPAISEKVSAKNNTAILSKKHISSEDISAVQKKLNAAKSVKQDEISNTKRAKGLEILKKIPVNIDNDDKDDTSEDSENEEVDDQTEALLKGFESDIEVEEAGGEYKSGEPIPEIAKKIKKKAKNAAEMSTSDETGVVYLGRIPHGFYEHEMRQYFGQFGDILRLRLSRNRTTGRSKHYAFLEFKSAEVAEIVVKTMDHYLLFGHILKCKLVKPEQVHPSLWKGANKRFKKVPWNKIEGRKLEQGMTEEAWNKRIEREEVRRVDKAARMKDIGYEFESPKLKSTKDIPKKQEALTSATDVSDTATQVRAIEAPKEVEVVGSALVDGESGKSKNKRFGKEKELNGAIEAEDEFKALEFSKEFHNEVSVKEANESGKLKRKKSKKAKNVDEEIRTTVEHKAIESLKTSVAEVSAPLIYKPKKQKKVKKTEENKDVVNEIEGGTLVDNETVIKEKEAKVKKAKKTKAVET